VGKWLWVGLREVRFSVMVQINRTYAYVLACVRAFMTAYVDTAILVLHCHHS